MGCPLSSYISFGHKIIPGHNLAVKTRMVFAIITNNLDGIQLDPVAFSHQSVQDEGVVSTWGLTVKNLENTLYVFLYKLDTDSRKSLGKFLHVSFFFCHFCCFNQLSRDHLPCGNLLNDGIFYLVQEELVSQVEQVGQKLEVQILKND